MIEKKITFQMVFVNGKFISATRIDTNDYSLLLASKEHLQKVQGGPNGRGPMRVILAQAINLLNEALGYSEEIETDKPKPNETTTDTRPGE